MHVEHRECGTRSADKQVCVWRQATDEPLFLHPRSALARAAPEFVAYMQLVRSAKRPYLAGTGPKKCSFANSSNIYSRSAVSGCKILPREKKW